MCNVNYINFFVNLIKMSDQKKVRTEIIKYFQLNPTWSYKKLAKHTKVCRQTVSNVIKQYRENLSVDRKPGSGRRNGPHDVSKAKKIERIFKRAPNTSGRKAARLAQCSDYLVRKVKANAGLKTYKAQKVPDRNAAKNLEAKNRARKLKSSFIKKYSCCIMDDETYVLADFSQLPGQKFYVADARGNVEEKFRTQKQTKFPRKFLVWQAICSCGKRSQSFVTTGSINTEIYIKECLQKRLLPFIRLHNVSTYFWPDLASCHYGKQALEWYKNNNVVFVPREANPPNCPELRPVERYWALVKRELKSTKKVSKSVVDFKRRWTTCSSKVTESTIKTLMEGFPKRVQNFITSD